MSLEELIELIPPPAVPESAGAQEQWWEVERQLGASLPQDYKQLVNTYGVGWFGNWICIYSPFSTRYPLINPPLWELIGNQGDYPEFHHPFDVFPTPGGLLPCGEDDNRSPFCWLTQGDPDRWQIVNLDAHYSASYRLLSMSITDLLAGWFAGRITGDWYPEDVFPTQNRVFQQGLPQY